MIRTRAFVACTFVLTAVLAPLRAGAIDLTGSWREVKNSPCTEVNSSGQKLTTGNDENSFTSLEITQTNGVLAATITGAGIGMAGFVHADAKKDEGRGLLTQCALNPFSGYQILSARTFPANAKGLSGRMTVQYLFGSAASTNTCKVIFERFSAEDPAGIGCP